MNFLSTFLSTFITNYFLIWIISLFNSKKRGTISLIVVSLADLSMIAYEAFTLWDLYIQIARQNAFEEYNYLLFLEIGVIVAIAIAYILTLVLLLGGKRVFKSRRQQQYLNSVKPKSQVPTIIALVILVLLGGGCLTYGIFGTINYDPALLVPIFGAYGMTLVFLGLAFYIFFINFTKGSVVNNQVEENTNVINANIVNKLKVDVYLVFILNLNNHKYFFKGILEEGKTMKDYLGKILDVYVLTDFGTINTPSSQYIVRGIKIDKIDEDLLKEIKMTRINQTENGLINILNQFERYRIKNFIVDENYNIIKIIEK